MQAHRLIIAASLIAASLLSARLLAPPVGEAPLVGLAAASLTQVLPAALEAAHAPAMRWSVGSSGKLARQLEQGAPADVFVSADRRWIDEGERAGWLLPGTRVTLATNRLVIIAPAGASWAPATLAALAAPTLGMRIAIGGEGVPAGRYARQAMARAGVQIPPAQQVEADDVRRALAWVAAGEVDAGLVYRTDALAEPRVRIVGEVDEALHDPIVYEAAIPASCARVGQARQALDILRGEEARAVWEAAGFGSARRGEAAHSAEQALAVQVREALWRSVWVALWVVALGLPLATGLGWVLARKRFVGKALVGALVTAPMVLPPVVTGYLILRVFGRSSWLGGALGAVGMPVTFHINGAILAALVVAVPLYVMSARAAFEQVDRELEESARVEGATTWQAIWHVSLPLAWPGLLAGAILAFMRALGEFGATAMVAGNIAGQTRTLSLAIYTALELPGGERAAWPLITATLVLSGAALVGYEALSRRASARR
jgi:molybdate transport system permease protein